MEWIAGVAGDQARIPGGQASWSSCRQHQEAHQRFKSAQTCSIQAFNVTHGSCFVGAVWRRCTFASCDPRRPLAWHAKKRGSLCGKGSGSSWLVIWILRNTALDLCPIEYIVIPMTNCWSPTAIICFSTQYNIFIHLHANQPLIRDSWTDYLLMHYTHWG